MKKPVKSENAMRKEILQLASDVARESQRITSEMKSRQQSFQKEWNKWDNKGRLV